MCLFSSQSSGSLSNEVTRVVLTARDAFQVCELASAIRPDLHQSRTALRQEPDFEGAGIGLAQLATAAIFLARKAGLGIVPWFARSNPVVQSDADSNRNDHGL